MAVEKPTTAWAIASLIASILGWHFAGVCLLMDPWSGHAGTAGIGAGFTALVGFLAGFLCLLGAIFGNVALVRIRGGSYEGRRIAWTGLLLGAVPLPIGVYVVAVPLGLVDFLRFG